MQENKDYLPAVLLRSAVQRHVTTRDRERTSPKIEGVTPALGMARPYGKRSVTKLNGTFKTRKRTLETHTYVSNVRSYVQTYVRDAFIIRTFVGQSRAKHHAVCDYHVREYHKLRTRIWLRTWLGLVCFLMKFVT